MRKNLPFALFLLLAIGIHADAQIITTIAGNGTFGDSGDGGPATAAEIDPNALCVDIPGNIYVGSHVYSEIRKINNGGIITDFAGNGTDGFIDNVPATMATISWVVPNIVTDKAGNVYFVDENNYRVRKVDTAGVITTIAGNGSYMPHVVSGGMATAASLEPVSIAVDQAGNVYIADGDFDSLYIRRVSPAGIITTVAGNGVDGFSGDGGPATMAEIDLNELGTMVADDSGNVYFADGDHYRVRKFNPSPGGKITTVAGNGMPGETGDGGQATAAELFPYSLAIDGAGNVFVSTGYQIRKVAPSGIITTIAGTGTRGYSGDGGPATAAAMIVVGIATDTAGSVYLADDGYYYHIRKITYHHYPPYFTGGHSLALVVCAHSGSDSINALLAVTNADTGQTNVWSAITAPVHGTLAAAYSAVASGGSDAPAGLYYAPAAGYSGNDSFKVRVTDGYHSDTTTVYVTINPVLSPITGAGSICQGGVITLHDATTRGTWSTASTAIATVNPISGSVTGTGGGLAIITYTAPVSCSPSFVTAMVTVNPLPATIGGAVNACLGEASLLTDATSGGAWHSGNTAVATVGSASGVIAGVALGTSIVNYTITATGCSITAIATVNPLPAAIAGTLPAAGLCRGVTAALTDATSGGGWSSNNTAIATVSAGAVTGIAPGTAIILYTLPSGCAATRTVTINSFSVPAAISGSGTVCQDTTTALTELATGGVWSSSGTAIATVDTGGRVRGVAPGMATITYSLAAGCAVEKTVSVIAAPAIFAVTGGGDFCTGTGGVPIGLSGSTVGASYQLFYGITYVGSAVAGTGRPLSFGSQTLEEVYTVIASYGATGCAMAMTGSASVTEEPLPAIYAVTGGGAYCLSGSGVHIGLDLSATGTSYRLYSGGIAMSLPAAGTGGSIDFGLLTAAGTYIIVATNTATGCTDTMPGTATVSVIPIVVPSVAIATSLGMGDTACAGRLLTITATSVNGGTGPSYIWSINGTPGPVSGATHSYLPIDGDRVTATLISSAVCAEPDSVSSATLALHVLASGAPAISITASPADTVCAGASVRFTPALSFGGVAPALTWVVNGSIAGHTGAYTYLPANGDSIACILGSNYQCLTTDSGFSNTITMVVADDATPVVAVSAMPGVAITYGQSVTLTATATHSSAPQYQWYINGIPVAGAIGSTFTDSTLVDGDSVSCQVIGNSVCDNAGYGWAVFEVNGEGVASPGLSEGEEMLRIWPNPGNGTFMIAGSMGTTDEDVAIEITDLPGQVIYQSSTNAPNGKLHTKVSLSGTLANGVYLLRVKSGGAAYVYRVVVER